MSSSQEQNSGKDTSEAVNQVTLDESEPIAEAIEEDDEFEEFEPCRWNAKDEDAEDAQQWQACMMMNFIFPIVIFHYLKSCLWIAWIVHRITGMTMILKTILHSNFEQNSCKIPVFPIRINSGVNAVYCSPMKR